MIFLLFSKFSASPFLFLFFKLKVKGRENIKDVDGPMLIVTNHTSYWDGILLQFLFFFKKIAFIAKSDVISNSKILSWFLSLYGVFSISHTDKSISILDKMIELINKGENVVIFPEGKINKTLQPFKKGAAYVAQKTDITILPMYISGKYGIFRRITVTLDTPFKVSDLELTKTEDLSNINQINTILYNRIKKLSTEE